MGTWQTERLIRGATYLMVAVACLPPLVQGQSVTDFQSAALEGHIRDMSKRPMTGATVYLRSQTGTKSLAASTDSEGSYHFTHLAPGRYSVTAELAGYRARTYGPMELADRETKTIDLVLEPSASPSSSLGTPELFDEPRFTVAGITDPTNLGGHGSNATQRTSESLKKGIVSLSGESPASSKPSTVTAATERSLRAQAEHEPENFEPNHKLGKVLLDEGRPREALFYLERASRLNPGDYDNSYQLALAYRGAAEYEHARQTVQNLLPGHDNAELHHLLGEIDDQLSDPLAAVQEYQRSAELEPSEPNLFDWAAELLIHRATEPSIAVFMKGHRLFPHSVRMLAGLGVAWYAQGVHDEAARRLAEASDLNPSDPGPYLLLGKMLSADPAVSDETGKRLERFAKLAPENALANYYYALSLWKARKDPAENLAKIEDLLVKAVHLDPKLDLAYLQLGILYSEQKDLAKAISAYQKAIEANRRMEEAHYRLGQTYAQAGENLKAQREIQLYKEFTKESADQAERQRKEIRQFLYTVQAPSFAPPPR
jgi:tetratricopeptide (TPR) repeat protein